MNKYTKEARRHIEQELCRLERHATTIFREYGFKAPSQALGIFRIGRQEDVRKLIAFAEELLDSLYDKEPDSGDKSKQREKTIEEAIIAVRIVLALPDLWNDYKSDNPNPWTLSSRLSILASAVPADSAKRLLLAEPLEENFRLQQKNEELKPLAIIGQKFTDGPKKNRLDVLGKIMLKTIKDYNEFNGELPTARQLWEAIPINDYIQEKVQVEEEGLQYIDWRTPSGVPKSTSFKSFQARITLLKKNHL